MGKAKEKTENAIDEFHKLLEQGGHFKGMRSKDAPVNEWLHTDEGYSETVLAVQEWGIKNNLRLFGIMTDDMDFGFFGPESIVAFRAIGYFVDPAFKAMELHVFDIKEKSGVVTVVKMKCSEGRAKGFKWPIKILRTKYFQTDYITPVDPLYWVLVDRKIILPFRDQLNAKEWAALPFEDESGIERTNAIV